jgi:hypothetical protein
LKDTLSALYNSVLLKALLNNPYAVAAVVILIWGLWTSSTTILTPLMIWFLTGFSLCVLTTIYGLRFLGEPGRYLNYAFVPGALIVTTVEAQRLPIAHQLLVGSVLVVGLIVVVGYVISHRMTSTTDNNQPMNDIVEFLKAHNPRSVVVQPRHMGSEIAWKIPEARVTDFFGDGYSSKQAKRQAESIFSSDPFITKDTQYLTKLLNPDWVVFDRENAADDNEAILRPPDVDAAFKSDNLEVYQWSDIIEYQ